MSAPAFPVVDGARERCISDEAADFFRSNGLLVLRNVIGADELARLQAETATLVDTALAGGHDNPDFCYKTHAETGDLVPFRVEYVVDKLSSTKALLGHPFLLRTISKLAGPAFVPTWDSMVFKMAGGGAAIDWHRDGGLCEDAVSLLSSGRAFNVDIYLDRADMDSCLWGLPGSNNWSDEDADAAIARLNEGGVSTEGAVPLPMEPGDVLLHNVLVLHGSRATSGPLRRVIYYEFRPADIELAVGPHTPEYVEVKQHVQAAAVRHRRLAPYAAGEDAYEYLPNGEADPAWAAEPPTWRYPHGRYLRSAV